MSKQTAVEFLFKEIYGETGHIGSYTTHGKDAFEALEQAKAMEREQIIDAHKQGEEFALVMNMPDSKEYYDITYKGGEQ